MKENLYIFSPFVVHVHISTREGVLCEPAAQALV